MPGRGGRHLPGTTFLFAAGIHSQILPANSANMTANPMRAVFIHLILLLQGIPLLPNQGGTVTGVLTTADSRPAAGVRVAVMVQPDNPGDVSGASALVSIAESDEAGRFRLENVPPGRYYVTAGRVELPTFYPGTLELASGKIVTVASGETLTGVNFSIKDVSDRGVETINAALRIPFQIHADPGARIPIFSERGKVRLRLTHIPDGNSTDTFLDAPAVTLPIAAGDYQVSVENLPDEFTMNSLTFGTTNLLTDKLRVTINDLPEPDKGEQITLTNTQTGIVVQRRIQGQSTYQQSGIVYGSITSRSELVLSVSAKTASVVPASGVQVRGKVYPGQEEAYISGKPGRLYADGSFEFRDVTAGRHIVFMLGGSSTSRQLSAVITVGNVDVENLQLQDTITLPLDVMTPAVDQTGLQAETSVPTMHSMKGHVVAESTGMPVAGIVTVSGFNRSTVYSLPADGEFEIPDLLPGSYGLKIETFDRGTLTRTFVVGEKDLDLNLIVPLPSMTNDK
jgi:hypothetical protein